MVAVENETSNGHHIMLRDQGDIAGRNIGRSDARATSVRERPPMTERVREEIKLQRRRGRSSGSDQRKGP